VKTVLKLTALALSACYPEHQATWQKLFISHGYWKDIENQRAFFSSLETKFNIKKPEDWNNVAGSMIISQGGAFIKRYYNGSVIQGTTAALCY
jgi:hypothetical protein